MFWILFGFLLFPGIVALLCKERDLIKNVIDLEDCRIKWLSSHRKKVFKNNER